MAQKFLIINTTTGDNEQLEATVTSAGAANAGDVVALDATGRLDESVMPSGFGDDAKMMAAGEDLNAGDYVNIYDDGGVTKVRKADATTSGKPCNGFVKAAALTGEQVKVFFEGTNDQVTGFTGGDRVFLSTTPGQGTATAPAAAGNYLQIVGVATEATSVDFEKARGTVLS